jgi:hypothetical protein
VTTESCRGENGTRWQISAISDCITLHHFRPHATPDLLHMVAIAADPLHVVVLSPNVVPCKGCATPSHATPGLQSSRLHPWFRLRFALGSRSRGPTTAPADKRSFDACPRRFAIANSRSGSSPMLRVCPVRNKRLTAANSRSGGSPSRTPGRGGPRASPNFARSHRHSPLQ